MLPINKCIVLEMKEDGRLPRGKHEAHPPHDWWYTSWSGGHQLQDGWQPSGAISNDGHYGFDETERWVHQWHCPGI